MGHFLPCGNGSFPLKNKKIYKNKRNIPRNVEYILLNKQTTTAEALKKIKKILKKKEYLLSTLNILQYKNNSRSNPDKAQVIKSHKSNLVNQIKLEPLLKALKNN